MKAGGDRFADPSNLLRHIKPEEGIKQHGSGETWFDIGISARGSQTSARKAASAMIADIPFDLAQWIARRSSPDSLHADNKLSR